jgi:hypothetical protein
MVKSLEVEEPREVFALPSVLTLRTRTFPNKQDTEALTLVRSLISKCGKKTENILRIEPHADWPAAQDPPGFKYPQLVAQGIYWKGLRAIKNYVEGMSQS